jgi:hypothetical protein
LAISERLIDRAYRQRIVSEAETHPLRHEELSRRELRRVEASIRDLKALIVMTEPGRPNATRVLDRGIIANHGPERLAVQVEGEEVVVVTGKSAGAQTMVIKRAEVHTNARLKYATALALRDTMVQHLSGQDWMITTLRGVANALGGLLTRAT